jgi:isochorismate pyruvate lyase
MNRPECKNLDDVRANIDRIDDELVRLMAERSGYVGLAARFKTRREEVVDPERIEDIIARIRGRSDELGMEADIAEQVFRTMIERFITFEYGEFDRTHGDS